MRLPRRGRRAWGAFAAAVALASLAACGGAGAQGSSDGHTIRFVGGQYSAKTEPYWQEVIKEFEAANPGYKVELEIVPFLELPQRINTLIQTNQQPDILNNNNFVGYADDELLRPASEVISAQTLTDFLPVFVEKSRYKDTQYALPFIASSRLLFYNKDLFARAGLSKPPTSWAEVEQYARAIKGATGKVGIGIPFGSQEAHAEFQMWAMNNGGGYVDTTGKWAVNSQANIDTMKFLKKLTDEGLTQPNPGTTNRNDVFNLFAAGEVGMLNGHIVLPSTVIDKQNPDLNYGVAPLPSANGSPAQTLGVQDYLMAFERDGNTEAVKKFLDFVYKQDNYVKFLKNETLLPTLASARGAFADDPIMKPFVEALPSAQFYPSTLPEWSDVQGAVKQQIGTALQGDDPAKVLGGIQAIGEGR